MMLVSSSGWAHSPITLIFTGLSIVFVVGGAVLPDTAMTIVTSAIAVRTRPKRFTSVPPQNADRDGKPLRCDGCPLAHRGARSRTSGVANSDIETADPRRVRRWCQADN